MIAQDVATLVRSLLDDLQSGQGQRFSDTQLLVWINSWQRKLMRDVMFPPARVSMSTVPNQQEYQYQGICIRPDSVYLNGQLLDPTDSIATLEWQQVGGYDTGYGASNPSPAPATTSYSTGSGLPVSTAGPFAPSWGTLTPQGYPVNIYGGWPAPAAEGSIPSPFGQRPRWYPRGGFIGIVPAPANGPSLDVNGNPIPNLVFDGIFSPPPAPGLQAPLIFPDTFDQALAWGCILFGKFSDDTQKTSESRNFALAQYKDAVTDCRMHVQSLKGMATQGPKIQLSRGYYAQNLSKNSRSSGYP
jgi:hypothetical protein